MMSQSRLDQLTGVDRVDIDGALGKNLAVDDRMGGIQINHHEHLVPQAPQGVDQVIGHILG